LYFVRTAAIFLIGSTVAVLIFAPKMYRLHIEHDYQASRRSGFYNGANHQERSDSALASLEDDNAPTRRVSFVQSEKSNTGEGKGLAENKKNVGRGMSISEIRLVTQSEKSFTREVNETAEQKTDVLGSIEDIQRRVMEKELRGSIEDSQQVPFSSVVVGQDERDSGVDSA
jgi:hypothetical protein